jgi:transcriptional regulator with XRE-family HTH domain
VPSKTSLQKPIDPWLKAVGENIRRERKAVQLTQEQLAEKADLAPRVLQKIEAGQITILISTLKRLKDALRCSYGVLLDSDEPKRLNR